MKASAVILPAPLAKRRRTPLLKAGGQAAQRFRGLLFTAVVIAAWSSGVCHVSAQGLDLQILKFGDRNADRYKNLVVNPIGVGDCEAELTLRLGNLPVGKARVDVWQGSNCNDKTNREGGANRNCTYLEAASVGLDQTRQQTQVDIIKPASAFINECTKKDADNNFDIFFLAVSTTESLEDVGNNWQKLAIKHDTAAPAAPTGVNGGSGESAIPVTWTQTNDTNIDRYVAYIDGGVNQDDCTSTVLVAGNEPPGDDYKVTDTDRDTAKVEINAVSRGLSVNQKAAVAVSAIDLAGNVSVLSEPACITVVSTDGFWDRASADGGAQKGIGCEVGSDAASPHALALCGLLGVWLIRRRRVAQ